MKDRIRFEGKKSLDKLLDDASQKNNKCIREANRMSARPGDDSSSSFSVQSYVDAGLSAKQSAEKFVTFFSQIRQEYTPIQEDISSPWMEVDRKLSLEPCIHPDVEEYVIYENMKQAKKTDSVPGDIPASILKEFLPEFTTPVTAIIKEAIHTHTWPEMYKKRIPYTSEKSPST